MEERRDQPPPEPDRGADEPACPCGSPEHQPLRIGEKLSPSGACIGGVYICPEASPLGLRGVL